MINHYIYKPFEGDMLFYTTGLTGLFLLLLDRLLNSKKDDSYSNFSCIIIISIFLLLSVLLFM
ncbi:hypothetical protein BJ944DRAFT_265554 [Cunninghamella echinulata]|nr:hypothetical protein BJ944DRAFT_265554 [Cunninghamella echinulata]